jgi:protein-disulfide isomerase
VARIGEQTLTLQEVDAKALAMTMEDDQQLYEARKRAVDEMLIDLEAQARGITRDQLIEQEINQKVKPVTDEEVAAFYEQNKARMGSQTLEEAKSRIRDYLTPQQGVAARQAFIDSLRSRSDVAILIQPPRADVTVSANDPSKGPSTAPVRIVAFSEFQCPYCARIGPTLTKIMETYGDRVQLVFRHYPLPMHSNAHPAAQAAQCAHEQGKFWEYHDKLFANQRALAGDNLKQYAVDLGLNAEQFNTCLDSGKYKGDVDQDFSDGQKLGVRGTPAFFVNGRFLSGARPFEDFQQLIDEELQIKGFPKSGQS